MLNFKTAKAEQYFKNSLWPIIEKVFRMILGFFVGSLVVRHLGPELFGKLSFAQSIVAIVGIIIPFGMDGVLVRELVELKTPEDRNTLLGTYSSIRAVTTFSILILTYIFSYFYFSKGTIDKTQFQLILILGLQFLFELTNGLVNLYQSQVRNKVIVKANLTALIFCSALRLILIYGVGTYKPQWFAFVIVLNFLITGVLLFKRYGIKRVKAWTPNKAYAKQLLKESTPYILSSILATLYMRIDQVMIERLIDSSSLGLYSSAVRLSEVFFFFPVAISGALFPSLVDSRKDTVTYHDKFQSLYGLMTWLAIGIAAVVSLGSHLIIQILYGSEYMASAQILVVHIWTSIFVFYGVVKDKWILTEKLQKLYLFYVFIGAIINIALNFFFIPKFGALGAAYTTLITQFVITIILPSFVSKDRISVKFFFSSFNIFKVITYMRTKL